MSAPAEWDKYPHQPIRIAENHEPVPKSDTGRTDSPVYCETCLRTLMMTVGGQWVHTTPSTKRHTDSEIRKQFIDDGGLAEYHDPINGRRDQERWAGKIFDAWLAEHDERIRRETLTEAGVEFVTTSGDDGRSRSHIVAKPATPST